MSVAISAQAMRTFCLQFPFGRHLRAPHPLLALCFLCLWPGISKSSILRQPAGDYMGDLSDKLSLVLIEGRRPVSHQARLGSSSRSPWHGLHGPEVTGMQSVLPPLEGAGHLVVEGRSRGLQQQQWRRFFLKDQGQEHKLEVLESLLLW